MFGFISVLLAVAVEIVAHGLALPRLPWAIGAGIAAVAFSAVARYAGGPTSVTLWQVTAICAAGAWLGWARFANMTTAVPWLLLAGAGVALAVMYPVVRNRHDRRSEAERRRAGERARLAAQNRWPRLLERIGHPGIRMTAREETESGYVLSLRLPGSGRVTISKLRNDLEQLEVAADARRGSLHFEAGETARDVLLYVSTRDFLAETIPYENNGEPLSIHDPVPIGRYEDGTICELTLREIAVLICGLRGSGKALALDTPVPTPDGWKTMGEIRAGDVVYDETGSRCRVTDAWDVRYGRPCYEIEFSDGSRVVADADHQWLVETALSRRSESSARRRMPLGQPPRSGPDQIRKNYNPQVLTTRDMAGSVRFRTGTADRTEANYSIRVATPLQGTDTCLPVPPYTLGAWLGDGWSATGAITTADPEILTQIESEGETVWIMPSTIIGRSGSTLRERVKVCRLAGYSPCSPTGKVVARGLCVNHWQVERRAGRLQQWPTISRDTETRARLASYRIGGLKVRLRELGVLRNKHIPTEYLRASEEQRRALLAGLLDTDGYCGKQGYVEFSSSRERLARDMHHLVATLGYKPVLRSKTARLNGKNCGTAWTVSFTPADKVFRLSRKAARQVTKPRATARHRYITGIRPASSVPVRCIAVDSPSHLYLVGEACIPTHNSNLLNVLIAQLVRCVDVLVFVIDMKYRLAMPWVRPYLEGEASGMAVDWAATSRGEAELMLRAFNRGIAARAASGGGEEEKIEPDARRPAVFLVIDELASIFGIGTGPKSPMEGTTNTTLAGLGTDAVRLGRSEAMDVIAASQRGTVTMLGSGDFKSQFAVQIGLHVANEADARSVIPDDPHAARILASLRHEGTGLVRFRESRGMRVKFFRITPQQITEIARKYGRMKPRPEHVLMEALGDEYQTRWERFRSGKESGPTAAGNGEDATDREFREITSQLGDIGREAALSPPRKRMREFIGRSGERGVTVTMITGLLHSERMRVDERTVRRWLDDDIGRGLLERTTRGIYRLRDQ